MNINCQLLFSKELVACFLGYDVCIVDVSFLYCLDTRFIALATEYSNVDKCYAQKNALTKFLRMRLYLGDSGHIGRNMHWNRAGAAVRAETLRCACN